ncbi:MAG: putative sugar nucleotidyl transferase, partial [Ignavibacteria bacterium]|nr:putative sugar nucleotidyl transferase [Ignavibacteria bacterium]
MKKSICVFEDEKFENLLPIVFLHPVYDLLCGILTLREKVMHNFPSYKLILHTRKILHNAVQERNPKLNVNNFGDEDILFINGRLLIDKAIAKEIKKLETNEILKSNNDIVAANVSNNSLQSIFRDNSEFLHFENVEFFEKQIAAKLFVYPWELVNENGNQIRADYSLLVREEIILKKFPLVEYTNKKEI